MISLSGRAFGPTSSAHDHVTYMTSVTFLRTLHTEPNDALIEQMKDMISTPSSRLQGLHMLELALMQNSDIYFSAHWSNALLDIIKESDSNDCRAKCCKIFGMILTILSKNPQRNKAEAIRLGSVLCPLMVELAESDHEWRESAFECLTTVIKAFPAAFFVHKEKIINIILKQMNTASCKSFEMYADCFCHIPFIQRSFELRAFEENWLNHYLLSLNTMNLLLNNLLTFIQEDEKDEIEEGTTYVFDYIGKDDFENRMREVRLFINFCRCLAKMLSTNSKYEVEVPIEKTFHCIKRLFMVEDIAKLNTNSMENQIVLSTLSQLQIAGLALLEPLLTNFDTQPYSSSVCHLIKCALQSSSLPNISKEPVSQLRHAVWKLLATWIECRGSKATYEIIHKTFILKELLSDISIQDEPRQTGALQSKTKKNTSRSGSNKNNYLNRNWYAVCRDALKALKRMVYSGATFFSKSISEDILSTVVNIAYAIHPSNDFPFPYTDERCRKNVYDVLLALTVVCSPDQAETLQFIIPVFSSAMRDPSNKVTALCHKAAATCRLALHPKKPPPLIKESDIKSNIPDISNTFEKFVLWGTGGTYEGKDPTLSEASNVPENDIPQISQTFRNEGDRHSRDYSQVEAHYSGQATEGQCNGEEMHENTVHCQDANFTDEDEEDGEEDEDEEERSFDEDMNPEIEIPAEAHAFNPSTSELQILAPAHINPETSHHNVEPELEELKPCGKPQDNEISNSNNKNVQNGVRDSVPDEEMPSAQNAASENGIFGSEDEEMEEEDEVEEEEEEEEPSYISEKKVSDIEPASKKPKIEAGAEVNKETKDDETDQRSRSPTLEEMKADFVFSDGEDVQS